jgi:hypothetical protein
MNLKHIISLGILCSTAFAGVETANSISVSAYSVADTSFISWRNVTPDFVLAGVIVFGSNDEKTWTALNTNPILHNYDTVSTNELLPNSFFNRAVIALKKGQFDLRDLEMEKKEHMITQVLKSADGRMFVNMAYVIPDVEGQLSGAIRGITAIQIGKPYKFYGVGNKKDEAPLAKSKTVHLTTNSSVQSCKMTAENELTISLISKGNQSSLSLIPFVEVYRDTGWYRIIHTYPDASVSKDGSHLIKYKTSQVVGKKVRIIPTVLGIYESKAAEFDIKEFK